jgi:hypothetical protein
MNREHGSSAKVVLLAVAAVSLIFGLIAAAYFKTFETQFAPGYSERKFNSIKIGDSESSVIARIGLPFRTNECEAYVEWIYSADKQPDYSETGVGEGTYTTIRFDDAGRAVSMVGMQQISARTGSFGDGANYLKLTEDDFEKLKGSTQSEIQKKFGPPVAVHDSSSVRILRYSRSPKSSHCRLRLVGLDKDAKVVYISKRIYWD